MSEPKIHTFVAPLRGALEHANPAFCFQCGEHVTNPVHADKFLEAVSEQKPPELLPCPFCPNGGDVWQPAPMHPVRCSQCGAEGPSGKTNDEIVTLWNTRIPATLSANDDARVQRLEAQLEGVMNSWSKSLHEIEELKTTLSALKKENEMKP